MQQPVDVASSATCLRPRRRHSPDAMERPLPPGFAALVSKLEALGRPLGDAQVLLDAVIREFLDAAGRLMQANPAVVDERPRRCALSREGRVALEQLAACGVRSLVRGISPDGVARFRIDGGGEFTLPPLLAELLVALAADEGPSDDDWVAWKSREAIIARISSRTGRRWSRHALAEAIHKLRGGLFAAGVNPFLINSHRSLGVRLAFRRGPATVIERIERDGR